MRQKISSETTSILFFSLSSSSGRSNMFGGGNQIHQRHAHFFLIQQVKKEEERKGQALLHPSLNFSHQSCCNEVQVDKTVLVRWTPNILLMQKPCTQPPSGHVFSRTGLEEQHSTAPLLRASWISHCFQTAAGLAMLWPEISSYEILEYPQCLIRAGYASKRGTGGSHKGSSLSPMLSG